MAETSAATLSIGTNASLGRKVGSLSQSKPFGVRFNSQNSLKSFSGLKAATSVSCESDSSFLGETIAALRGSIALKAQKEKSELPVSPAAPGSIQSGNSWSRWRYRSAPGTSYQDVPIEKRIAFANKQAVAA